MISGHAGALTTIHANTPRDAASRLETLCLMSDAELPISVARAQVASAIHLVVQVARFMDGSRRVQSITECLGIDDQQRMTWRELFRFEGRGRFADGTVKGELVATGNRPTFAAEVFQMGLEDRINLTAQLFNLEQPCPEFSCAANVRFLAESAI
jgi:pilus assembly protein CpaF